MVSSIRDAGEGREMGAEGAMHVRTAGGHEGEVDSKDEQGAAVGEVSICGGEEISKELMGQVSTEGEGEN